MRNLIRSLIILGLIWLEVVLYQQVQRYKDVEGSDTKIVVLFLGIISVAIVIGLIVAAVVVPAIGEAVGSFFFNPDQEIEKDPHSDAASKVAQGDYEGAIQEYTRLLEENPNDMHAVSEIIHLYCDKLGDHDAAEECLEEALKHEWPAEQGAFLASRLVDVYWNYKHDAVRAKHVLQQIAESMPETKHAANAVHRLHEIDRVVAEEEAGIRLHSKPALEGEPETQPEG